MLKKLKQDARTLMRAHRANQISMAWCKDDFSNLKTSYLPGITLTKEERTQIENKWSGSMPIPISRGYDYFLGMKCLGDFNPNYLPSAYYAPYILDALNIPAYKKLLCHKSILQMAYGIGIKFPKTLIRSYGGVLLDENFYPVLRKDAAKIIRKQSRKLLYKPSTDSMQGKGIKLYTNSEDIDRLCIELGEGNLLGNGDFVIQECVSQCADTEIFNRTSLNCIRITTFNINDRVSVGSSAIKCGPIGSFVDNIGSGKKGVLVGIDMDGCLHEHGFYGNGEKVSVHNDVEFKGKVISNFHRVVDAAIELHKFVEGCRLIGWDLALDDQNEPVLIEGNVISPGISLEQMCSGPIFGERTDEVIRFLKTNRINASK